MYALWIVLILISIMGIFLGMFYYVKPEAVVMRRIKKHNVPVDDQDPQFQKWLRQEFDTQVAKTRKMGKVIAIFESVWLLVILIFFFNSLRS